MVNCSIELRLTGKRVVVVGLGAVGQRKAAGLLEAGAIVSGIDPSDQPLNSRFDGLRRIRENYRAEHLDGAVLAFAAAIPPVNAQVVADAKARGIWVNSASDPHEGDFFLPAVWRDGSLTLTVSTGGVSPALAVALRDRAKEAIGDAARLLKILEELRPTILERLPAEERSRLLRDWADPRWLDLLSEQGPERVAELLRQAAIPDGSHLL